MLAGDIQFRSTLRLSLRGSIAMFNALNEVIEVFKNK